MPNRAWRRANKYAYNGDDHFLNDMIVPIVDIPVITEQQVLRLQSMWLDVYHNKQVFTAPSKRNILREFSGGKGAGTFRGVVADVRYGYYDEHRGKVLKNVPKAICVMFPEIKAGNNNWVKVDSHCWLYVDKLIWCTPDTKDYYNHLQVVPEEKIWTCLGDSLKFYATTRTYKSKGITRYGISNWMPLSSHLIYQLGGKVKTVSDVIKRRAPIFSINNKTCLVKFSTRRFIDSEIALISSVDSGVVVAAYDRLKGDQK